MAQFIKTVTENQLQMMEIIKGLQSEVSELIAAKNPSENHNEDDVPEMTDAELDEIAGRGL